MGHSFDIQGVELRSCELYHSCVFTCVRATNGTTRAKSATTLSDVRALKQTTCIHTIVAALVREARMPKPDFLFPPPPA